MWLVIYLAIIGTAVVSGLIAYKLNKRPPKVISKAYELIDKTFEIVAIDDYHTNTDWFRFGTAADFIAYAEKNKAISGVFETCHGDMAFIFYMYEDRMYCVEIEKWVRDEE